MNHKDIINEPEIRRLKDLQTIMMALVSMVDENYKPMVKEPYYEWLSLRSLQIDDEIKELENTNG